MNRQNQKLFINHFSFANNVFFFIKADSLSKVCLITWTRTGAGALSKIQEYLQLDREQAVQKSLQPQVFATFLVFAN